MALGGARPTRAHSEAAVAAHRALAEVGGSNERDRVLQAATRMVHHRGPVVGVANRLAKCRPHRGKAATRMVHRRGLVVGVARLRTRPLAWGVVLLWVVRVADLLLPTNKHNQAFQQGLAAALKHSNHNLTSQHRLELDLGQGVRHSVPSRKYYILFVYMGLVEEILKQFPDCDRMMAETIAKMYEQGRLEEFLPMLSVPAKDQGEQSEPGRPLACRNIEVHLPEEKTLVESIPWSEDKSAV